MPVSLLVFRGMIPVTMNAGIAGIRLAGRPGYHDDHISAPQTLNSPEKPVRNDCLDQSGNAQSPTHPKHSKRPHHRKTREAPCLHGYLKAMALNHTLHGDQQVVRNTEGAN